MSYHCCGGSCQGYAASSGDYASRQEPVKSSYSSSAKSVRVIGCTCGGVTACKGTCRMPMPE